MNLSINVNRYVWWAICPPPPPPLGQIENPDLVKVEMKQCIFLRRCVMTTFNIWIKKNSNYFFENFFSIFYELLRLWNNATSTLFINVSWLLIYFEHYKIFFQADRSWTVACLKKESSTALAWSIKVNTCLLWDTSNISLLKVHIQQTSNLNQKEKNYMKVEYGRLKMCNPEA